MARRGGLVVFGKKLDGVQRRAIVEDVERGFLDEIRELRGRPIPASATGIIRDGSTREWLQEFAKQVIQRLADVVSKNGNLLLNIPVRGNGTIDEKEAAIVDEIASWTGRNGEAIFGTRPWRKFGEGPTRPPRAF